MGVAIRAQGTYEKSKEGFITPGSWSEFQSKTLKKKKKKEFDKGKVMVTGSS